VEMTGHQDAVRVRALQHREPRRSAGRCAEPGCVQSERSRPPKRSRQGQFQGQSPDPNDPRSTKYEKSLMNLEAPPGFEPGVEVLQT
jgi:hypothetical protein